MSGLARAQVNISDLSFLTNTATKGICNVLGVTERGPVNTPTLVSSWNEYQRTFGGLLSTSNFPLLCKRALDGGAKLYVSRVAHYGTITDASTITGTKAVSTDSNFRAKNIGTWGNNLKVVITAVSGAASRVNLAISLTDYARFDQVIQVNATLTAEDIALINASALYIDCVASAATVLSPSTVTFSTGANTGTIVDADYTGSAQSQTGIYSFDTVTDAWYIAVPDQAKNAIDLALADYCDARKDLRPLLRTPTGLTKTAVLAYRQAISPYAGTAIDSWRAMLFTGGLKINHPTTNEITTIPEIGDVIARISVKDNKGNPWDSFSGQAYGKIPNNIGVAINYGSPVFAADGIELVNNGVNPVISHPTFKTVIWGNRSLLNDTRKVLKYAHVGDIVMHLQRYIQPFADDKLFQPNRPATWRSLYNSIQPELDRLEEQGALFAWEYNGDQFVDRIQDCQINSLQDIDAGKYSAYIRLYVVSKMEYIDINLQVTGGAALLEIQA